MRDPNFFEKAMDKKEYVVKSSKGIRWRCCNKRCAATFYTINGVFSRKFNEHNHGVKIDAPNRQNINNAVKRKAMENIAEKP